MVLADFLCPPRRALLVLSAGALALLAALSSCARGVNSRSGTPVSATPTGGDDGTGDSFAGDDIDSDSGAFGTTGDDDGTGDATTSRDAESPGDDGPSPADGGDGDGAPEIADADAGAGDDAESAPDAAEAGAADSGYDGPICATPLGPGDLYIDEIMTASVAGDGDEGEWVEVWNPSTSCGVQLTGVFVSSPRGSSGDSDSASLSDGHVIPPGGFVVVADSADPSFNHGLPSPVYAWNASGVLSNSDTDSVVVSTESTILDLLTFDITPDDGVSLEDPAACAADREDDVPSWKHAVDTYGSGGAFRGTPNAVNGDVTCD